MQVKIKENSWLARIAAAKMKASKVAIVFGSTIHLHNTSREEFLSNPKWVSHELKHVEQYQENGFIKFIGKYLLEWLRKGYTENKFEVAARESEEDEKLWQKTNFT